ncbi:coiled-coil domain-containing protein [Flavilitoribacter nigricans]|uniref:AsmA-like C-terminal domain-containing protein n=1 Tax=Flavilitoribacter nigricans (strain ATCC 23147 / DSM 23189 / NBRC 102662 / NCIMB 1420 / SS-2) TaxID=1122177 RepID=A0A2D0NHY1_FLAN2|nr:hypothetical protein [Flavilitoribacter nigricans]PHN08105.1 hypothetical protein CRP01_01935 [Flavilitoribacter nigricans DSM 23189 = NBRC 102662]
MKTIGPFFLFLLVHLSTSATTPGANDWKLILQDQLAAIMDQRSFSLEKVDVNTGNREITGQGTFFGVTGVHFRAAYTESSAIGDFTLEFPERAELSIRESAIGRLTGGSLAELVPAALGRAVYLQQFGFSVSKTDKQIAALHLGFRSPVKWHLLPGNNFPLQQIALRFQVDHPTDKKQRRVKGILNGRSFLGSTPVDLEAELGQQREALTLRSRLANVGLKSSLQAIAGQSAFQGISLPDAVIDLQLEEGTLSVLPYRKQANIVAQSNLGTVDAWMQNAVESDKKMDYVVVISPPAGFKLSSLNDRLKSLDAIDLSGQKIVLTSEDKDKKESSKIPSLAQMSAAIKRGANLLARLDLTKLRLEHLLRAKELVVSSPLGDYLADVVLESAIDVDVPIGPTTKMSNVLFRLQPAPNNFSIALVGVVDAQVSRDDLVFKGGMDLAMSTQTLSFMSVMDDNWNNPLGAKGLVMSKVGLQLGGSFGGAAILPNMAFSGEIKVGRFSGSSALAFDTRDPAKSMLSAEISQLYVSDIMESVIDPRVMRKLPDEMKEVLRSIRFNDVHLEFVPQPLRVLEKSYEPGFRMGGNVDIMGINGFGNVEIDYENGMLAQGEVDPIDLGPFKLTGAGNNERPGFVIDLRMNKEPKVALNGLVSMLGMQAETEVEVLPNGFRFDLGGKVFNVFNGSIMASAADLERLGSIETSVQMQQDLFGFLNREVTSFIENEVGEAIKKLSAAQGKITQAQSKVNELDGLINQQRAIVRKDMNRKKAKYDAARRDVTNAQKKVNSLDKSIRAKKRELKEKDKAWQVAERGVIRTQIASLYTARGVAWTALEGYKKILEGLGHMNTNPDIHPKVASLIASKVSALGTLEAAKITLEGLKITLGATGKAATFIIEKGTKALINVRRANFAGQLGSLSGGAVDMDMNLEWMGKQMDLRFNFDFNNPLQTVAALGKRLLDQ